MMGRMCISRSGSQGAMRDCQDHKAFLAIQAGRPARWVRKAMMARLGSKAFKAFPVWLEMMGPSARKECKALSAPLVIRGRKVRKATPEGRRVRKARLEPLAPTVQPEPLVPKARREK